VRVVSLGSGSSGNALLVEAGSTRVLVDAGFAPRVLRARLRQAGIAPDTVQAILLTHEHHDHACGAADLALELRIPLVADPRTLDEVLRAPAALRRSDVPERVELRVGQRRRVGALEVRSFPVSHDAVAPCGYVVSGEGWSICVAVDTGVVSDPIAAALQSAHLLVIEANHDEHLLEAGPYPRHLKRRIRGATGHLSNHQTTTALATILDDGPRWIWLAHLSRTNNTPDLARATVQDMLHARDLRRVVLQVAPPSFGPVWDSPAAPAPRLEQPSLWLPPARPPADALPPEESLSAPAPRPAARAPAATPPARKDDAG
jgi:phosphoribosyl 1,2-cyclic phosphodiesterase